jgi:ribosomal protein S18 acetylase RimI-like enzyme
MLAKDAIGDFKMRGAGWSVHEAQLDQRVEVSATLADALASDPVFSWLFPSERRRGPKMRRLFALELAYWVFPAGGRALTTDGVRGANVEIPPRSSTMTVPLPGAVGLLRVFGIGLCRAARLQAFFDRNHPQEPHYYIRTLGVATRFQGQGLGTALLQPTLDRCDRECVPAYLEASTERSAALYQRLGFIHLGELRIPDGGPPFWPMLRTPTAA